MAFESLSEKLKNIARKLSGKGVLSEADVKNTMREVKLALLEADVNFKVVKQFISNVTERAVGQEVAKSLTPGQQIIKIVNEELTKLMGGQNAKLKIASMPPTVIVLCGLQGVGNTTMAAKLGLMLKKRGKTPLLAACDVYRPAASEQLNILAKQAGLKFYAGNGKDPVAIAKEAIEQAKKTLCDTVIIDTAGRLHIDDEMINEIKQICAKTEPDEILLVADAMTGQDAVNIASSFNEAVEITGIILTKLDGDTRGGAALSMREVTGKPIKFAGVGEKLENIEEFHPDRMASRILGMGDVLSLIEKAQESYDEEATKKLEKKLRAGGRDFTLEDFLDQFDQIKKMGGISDIAGMLPGINTSKLSGAKVDENNLKRMQAIILSMTKDERNRPEIINASRRRRIAKGSGTSVNEVNRLINQFDSMKKIMKQFAGGKKRGINFPFI